MPQNNFEIKGQESVEEMIEREAAGLEAIIQENKEAFAAIDPKTCPENFFQKLQSQAVEALETLGIVMENLQGEAMATLGTKASVEDPAMTAVREGINAIAYIGRKTKEWIN